MTITIRIVSCLFNEEDIIPIKASKNTPMSLYVVVVFIVVTHKTLDFCIQNTLIVVVGRLSSPHNYKGVGC